MLDVIRGIVRPILALSMIAAWCYFIATGTAYPEAFEWATLGILSEWVGERIVMKVVERVKIVNSKEE